MGPVSPSLTPERLPFPYFHALSQTPDADTPSYIINKPRFVRYFVAEAVVTSMYIHIRHQKNSHLRHGEIVHEDRHLLAPRRTKVLTPPLVELNFDRVLAHERRRRAREVDPVIDSRSVGGSIGRSVRR